MPKKETAKKEAEAPAPKPKAKPKPKAEERPTAPVNAVTWAEFREHIPPKLRQKVRPLRAEDVEVLKPQLLARMDGSVGDGDPIVASAARIAVGRRESHPSLTPAAAVDEVLFELREVS